MKVRILTSDEIFGENKLNCIKKYGSKCAASDFAICLGAWTYEDPLSNNKDDLIDRTPWYWTMTPYRRNTSVVDASGNKKYGINVTGRNVGVRPVLEFSSIDEIQSNGKLIDNNKWKYGMYAVNALPKSEQDKWTGLLKCGILKKVKGYTSDSVKYSNYDKDCIFKENECYEYNEKKAVRVRVRSRFGEQSSLLSNGERYKDGDYVWIEVKDYIWDLEMDKLLAVSPFVSVAGIPFDNKEYRDEKNFYDTILGKYLNEIFLKELTQFSSNAYENTVTDDSKKININELLEKIKSQEEYIKILEHKNEEYKKMLDKISQINQEYLCCASKNNALKLSKPYDE